MLRGIRVAQGVLARALMAACQELADPAEQVREFRRVVDLLFAFMDAFSSRMTAEYSAEHDLWLTRGAAAREETVRAVLDGQPVREEAASELLAYRLEGRHLAVVAWCESPTADTTGDLQRAAAPGPAGCLRTVTRGSEGGGYGMHSSPRHQGGAIGNVARERAG
ncbi:hypothetical protein [Streptomyces cyaneofuscatus]|uniref:hypothetical protein n=1 Tax=Streptomyces cyaneofuscatus TaxID=66883 RepID=UPI0037B7533B